MVTHGRGIRPFQLCIESRVSEREELNPVESYPWQPICVTQYTWKSIIREAQGPIGPIRFDSFDSVRFGSILS